MGTPYQRVDPTFGRETSSSTVILSTTLGTLLIGQPPTGMTIFLTNLVVGNASVTQTNLTIADSSRTFTLFRQSLAASGGGMVFTGAPYLQVQTASMALVGSLTPAVSDVSVHLTWFLGAPF